MSFLDEEQKIKLKSAICVLLDRAAGEILKKGGVLKFEEVEIFGRSEVDKEEF